MGVAEGSRSQASHAEKRARPEGEGVGFRAAYHPRKIVVWSRAYPSLARRRILRPRLTSSTGSSSRWRVRPKAALFSKKIGETPDRQPVVQLVRFRDSSPETGGLNA